MASSAAPVPKFEGQECVGRRVLVTDPQAAEPYTLGVSLLHELMGGTEFEWLRNGDVLSRLLGTPRVLEDLRAEKSVGEILAADRQDHEQWRQTRQAFLLY